MGTNLSTKLAQTLPCANRAVQPCSPRPSPGQQSRSIPCEAASGDSAEHYHVTSLNPFGKGPSQENVKIAILSIFRLLGTVPALGLQAPRGIKFELCQGRHNEDPRSVSSRPRLSVAMIVRDEQDVLAQSIESVRGLADEIVVLDTGSTDRTPQLAGRTRRDCPRQSLGKRLRRRAELLSAARVAATGSSGLTQVNEIAADDAARLRVFLDCDAKATTAYTIMVEVPPRDEGASAEQVAQFASCRPTRASDSSAGSARHVDDSLRAAGLAQFDAPCRIHRHPRQHDPERFLAKARRDLDLATAEAEASGKWPPRLLLAAGQAHGVLGQQDQARELLRQAIEILARPIPP